MVNMVRMPNELTGFILKQLFVIYTLKLATDK